MCQLVLASIGLAGDLELPSPGAPESAYYECVVNASKRYGRKAADAHEAVEAAKGACHEKRAVLFANECLDMYGANTPIVGYCMGDDINAVQRAEWRLRRIEGKLHPFFIQAALDGR